MRDCHYRKCFAFAKSYVLKNRRLERRPISQEKEYRSKSSHLEGSPPVLSQNADSADGVHVCSLVLESQSEPSPGNISRVPVPCVLWSRQSASKPYVPYLGSKACGHDRLAPRHIRLTRNPSPGPHPAARSHRALARRQPKTAHSRSRRYATTRSCRPSRNRRRECHCPINAKPIHDARLSTRRREQEGRG